MLISAEMVLPDSVAIYELDKPLFVQAGLLAFVLERSGDNIRMYEDYRGNARRLFAIWPSQDTAYENTARNIISEGLVLEPGEEVVLGKSHGLEVYNADHSADAKRAKRNFDETLRYAFTLDTSLAERHVAITALSGGNVHLMDLSSENCTYVQRIDQ